MKLWPTLFATITLCTNAHAAEPDPDACSNAYGKGQEDRLAGRLYAARSSFLLCESVSCSADIAADCARWRHEVEQDLPTIRLQITDIHDSPITPNRVTADGEAIAPSALAAPIILEAGPHTLRVEAEGFEPSELDRALRPTDRELAVSVTLHRLGEASVTTPVQTSAHTSAVPTATWVLGGIGVASLGAALYFGLSSHNQYEDLKHSCAPYCPQSLADSVRTKSIVSDVTLVTGAAALGAAFWLYFSAKPQATTAASSHTTTALQVAPTQHGGALRLNVTF